MRLLFLKNMKLKTPIEIIGQGAVGPFGCGIDPLLSHHELKPELFESLKCGTAAPSPFFPTTSALGCDLVAPTQPRAAVLHSKNKHVLRCKIPPEQSARWQKEPRLRRASLISLFMVEAAVQACAELSPEERKSVGIISSYFTGSIIYTRRFFSDVVESGQRFASPMFFPETVFNSPTSHLANILGSSGPCYSIVGDESAFVNAITIAACWMQRGIAKHVLVLGAEELEPIVVEAFVNSRWIRPNGNFVPSEGAGALLLQLGTSSDRVKITEIHEGFGYRNRNEARKAAFKCVGQTSTTKHVFKTAQKNWFRSIEEEVHLHHGFVGGTQFPYAGEAFTASAAWNTMRAAATLEGQLLLPVWGLNQQCSALLLDR
jgi:hypothetical protein